MNVSRNKDFYLSLVILLLLMTGLMSSLILVQRRQLYEKKAESLVKEEGLLAARNTLMFGAVSDEPGRSGSFPLDCVNEDEIGAVQLEFSYDSTIGLEITEVRPAERTSGWTVNFSQNKTDPSLVKVIVLLSNMTALTIAPGSGGILTNDYSLTTRASGQTALDITKIVLSDFEALPLEVNWEDGTFTVLAPTPTPSPTPTLTPTPTPGTGWKPMFVGSTTLDCYLGQKCIKYAIAVDLDYDLASVAVTGLPVGFLSFGWIKPDGLLGLGFVFSSSPSTRGTYNLTARATDKGGREATKPYTLIVH